MCLDYDSRGLIVGFLKVQISKEGIHSGGSGIVRNSFHVVRALSDQIVSTKDVHMNVMVYHYKLNVKMLKKNYVEGVPDLKRDNLLKKYATVKLSIHTPLMDPKKAAKILTDNLTAKPLSFIANVEFDCVCHFIGVNGGNITPRNAHASRPLFSPRSIASITDADGINSNDGNNGVNIMNIDIDVDVDIRAVVFMNISNACELFINYSNNS